MTRYLPILVLTACTTIPPRTPEQCREVEEAAGWWSSAAVVAPAAPAVPLVIAATADSQDAQWRAMGVGLVLAGVGTLVVGEALEHNTVAHQCREPAAPVGDTP